MEWEELYGKWKTKNTEEEVIEEEEEEEKEEKEKKEEAIPLSIRLERLEAKFDLFEDLRKALEEKISHLSEQIGELRSMTIEREKFYSDVEISAKRMESIIEMVRSEDVIKQLRSRKAEIEENKARIERIEKIVERFSEEAKELRNLLERIRPLENILQMAERMDEKIRIMEEKRRYVENYVEKIEKIYVDVKGFISDTSTLKLSIENVQDAIKDLVKLVDELRTEYHKFVTKTEDELEKLKTVFKIV